MNSLLRTVTIVICFFLYPHSGALCAGTQKARVEKISFHGVNAFKEQRLLRTMITRASRLFNPYYFNEDIFDDDLKSLETFYHNNGFLDAAISNYDVLHDSTFSRVAIDISISEGTVTRIEGVNVFGNTAFPDSLLIEKIGVRSGDCFLRENINDANVTLLTLYADHGFLDAEINPDIRINPETHFALLDYYIIEKQQFRIGGIKIKGLDKTRESVVKREIQFQSDEIINYASLLETQRKIYMSGLFQSVFIRPRISDTGDSTQKDILVEIKENFNGEFNVSLGYGSVDRARCKMEVFNNNIRGSALKLGLTGKLSFIQQGLESSYTNPWTFGIPLRSDANLFIEKKGEPGYEFNRLGGRIVMGHRFHNENVTVTYRSERIELFNVKVEDIPDELTTNIHSFKISHIHDTRNNLFNATNGLYVETGGEIGAFFTEKTSSFYRFTGMIKYFRELNMKTVIASSIELGLIDAKRGLSAIPLHERFYAGGPMSLRGFKYQRLGSLDSNNLPIGGRLKIVWNLIELRRTVYKMIGGVLFVDIGNIWSQPKNVRIRDMRISPGLGIRITTPIGLARLDYGFNIDRKENESGGQLYFNMGQAF
ncbi:outer membrane protein assembly factor BamA [Candidatus Latescibacterota bacterium]